MLLARTVEAKTPEEGLARGPATLLSAPPGGNCHHLLLEILGSRGCGVQRKMVISSNLCLENDIIKLA